MPFPLGSIPLTGAIGVGDAADTFGTHFDYLGVGGYRSVANQSTMTGISPLRRTKGMLVRNNANGKIYTYISDDGTNDNTVTNAVDAGYNSVTTGWKELQLGSSGGGSGTLTSVTLTQGDQIGITPGGTSTDPTFTFSLSTIPTTKGGTNITTYATGDLLYASGSNTLSKLTKPGADSILAMDSAGAPSWLAQTTFEVPITVTNGLTRSSNSISLGGTLGSSTTLAFGNNKLSFTSTNNTTSSIFDFQSESTMLVDLKANGTLTNFFSTKEIPLPSSSGTTTLKSSTLPLNSSLASSNTGTTIINHASTTAVSNMPTTSEYSSGNAINYTINQHTFTLTQKSGNQDNIGIGNNNSTINMFRYFLTNSIWRAASGGSGTGYTNGTWELARLYSIGLSSNTSSLSGSTRISQPGATFFTLANPGHGSAFRVLVGDKTVGLDSITLGYDSITFPTATSTGSSVIGAYSGQTLAFGISVSAYSSPTSSPGDITSYLTINTTNNVSLPDSGTATGSNSTSVGNASGWSYTDPIIGTQSRSLNWRVRTHTGKAATYNAGTNTYTFGRNITLNTISKSYPHLSSSASNIYDFRQRWLLFTWNPSNAANNNPGITFPDFYNSSTKVLDGSNSSPIRSLDILSGDYSADGNTSLGGQVAVGVSLGAGEIPSAKVTVGASTSSQAAIRLYSGATVTSPSNGDIWFDGTDLCIRIGGNTKKIAFQP